MIMGQTPHSVTLLAHNQARSDDAEANSFEEPLAAPAVHPFTGTFAASEHTVEFGSKTFRAAFPLHVFAMALLGFLTCAGVKSENPGNLPGFWAYIKLEKMISIFFGGSFFDVLCAISR